jgi:hypothetical protein
MRMGQWALTKTSSLSAMVQKINRRWPDFTPGVKHHNQGLQRPRTPGRRSKLRKDEQVEYFKEHRVLL